MVGRDFLELAERLSVSYGDEASLRTIVSRCYYASFHHVKDFLTDNNINLPENAKDHITVSNYLRNSSIKDAIKLGKTLSYMRNRRNDADYQLHSPEFDYTKVKCILFYKKAELFLIDFDKLIKLNKSELLKGIRTYIETH